MVITPEPSAESMPSVSGEADATPEAAASGAEQLYEDPEERFTIPIPAEWTVEVREDYTLVSSPESLIELAFVTVEGMGDELEAAAQVAWETVDPEFDLAVDDAFDQPVGGGWEAIRVVEYKTDIDTDGLFAAVNRRYQGDAYVMLIRAHFVTFQQRRA